ncbi:TPA: hypothetical protein R1907_002265 [Staphylococcus delphini]|uniref:hypothetical protein n=1 Tax=Staphylococcus delphini TaxID=53344 RepID=UPI000BBC82E9|nr:hypothetical protein [Staphylococcus delphini]PCF44576.1 hypothetical protein B5B98_11960 [Staphylococcus delphini]PCF71049.1 hypothetical protein B4W73_11775 [Staphylococcus delphini]HEC2156530.1 hypothetical protein [Staphylococcus delphini]HEC2176626.1 hypothetical protein [Staphylococcus delphini]
MINYRSYSDEKQIFMLNIGGLVVYSIRKKVIKVIEKLIKPFLPQHHRYTFIDVDEVTVLIIQAETQFIPTLIRRLCKKGLAIYEVKLVEEQDALFDQFSAHMNKSKAYVL